jgi:hypothetical protein
VRTPFDGPIATREFENRDGPVVMEIYQPVANAHGGFDCRFLVRWADGREKGASAGGVDSMQALLMAISGAWVRMLYPNIGQRDESLTFLGNCEMDLRLVGPPEA